MLENSVGLEPSGWWYSQWLWSLDKGEIDQSIPAFTQATREEEEQNETPCVLGAAQESTRDHPGGGEDYE